ncbi:MAG: hypothetical protein ABI895_04060 [Deltaproteobacteria bacterium]
MKRRGVLKKQELADLALPIIAVIELVNDAGVILPSRRAVGAPVLSSSLCGCISINARSHASHRRGAVGG